MCMDRNPHPDLFFREQIYTLIEFFNPFKGKIFLTVGELFPNLFRIGFNTPSAFPAALLRGLASTNENIYRGSMIPRPVLGGEESQSTVTLFLLFLSGIIIFSNYSAYHEEHHRYIIFFTIVFVRFLFLFRAGNHLMGNR